MYPVFNNDSKKGYLRNETENHFAKLNHMNNKIDQLRMEKNSLKFVKISPTKSLRLFIKSSVIVLKHAV